MALESHFERLFCGNVVCGRSDAAIVHPYNVKHLKCVGHPQIIRIQWYADAKIPVC